MAKENVDWMTENYNERNFNETKQIKTIETKTQ